MTTPDSAVAAASSDQSVLRWPVFAVALFLATDSARTTMTEYFVTPFARTAFLVGISVAAVGWMLILRHEHEYLRHARATLPYAELRRLPAPIAGRLCSSLLFRWSVVFCITVASVEYVLTIADLKPGTGAVAGLSWRSWRRLLQCAGECSGIGANSSKHRTFHP